MIRECPFSNPHPPEKTKWFLVHLGRKPLRLALQTVQYRAVLQRTDSSFLQHHHLATRGAEGPHKQPKRGRLWLADGSCIRLRPEQRNHVWSYDFVEDRTHDGRKYRMLNVLDDSPMNAWQSVSPASSRRSM